jgi:hypothetical protein
VRLGARHWTLGAVAVVVAMVGAGGHGSGSSEARKSPDQIATDAYNAAVKAKTVRVSGDVSTSGQQLAVNLSIRQGKAVEGSLTLQGDAIKMVVIGPQVYFSASGAYYVSQGESTAVANELNGKWVKLPASQAKDFAEFEHLSQLLGSLNHPTGTLSKDGTTTVAGMGAILVKSTKGGEVAVATHGTPFPLQLLAGTTGTGSLTFSDWNKPVTIKKPASYLDLSSS